VNAPERLLSALVASPAGIREEDAVSAVGAGARTACRELRRRGHVVREDGGRWVLACRARHFDPAAFAAAVQGELGRRAEIWETTPSTNDLARDAAARGAPHGSLWLAEAQTEGRGRQGRTWSAAPHAALLVSIVVRGVLRGASPPTLLPIAAALGAGEALEAACGLRIDTKWPNDLWIGGKKVAGLLVEARGADAVLGLGVNVGDAAPRVETATSLAAHAAPPRREQLLAGVCAAIEQRLGDLAAGRSEAILHAWLARDLVIGRAVRLETASGIVEGRALALTRAGLLRIEVSGGTEREVAAGEVHLR
jgi:BirA family biotin operon repressor/biotin-[acetyl-CoA-carboxylase] ligase